METLDELLLAVPRPTPLRFDSSLGFHFYGADLCMQARRQGLAAAVLDVPCFHNSRSVGLPAEFFASGTAWDAFCRARSRMRAVVSALKPFFLLSSDISTSPRVISPDTLPRKIAVNPAAGYAAVIRTWANPLPPGRCAAMDAALLRPCEDSC